MMQKTLEVVGVKPLDLKIQLLVWALLWVPLCVQADAYKWFDGKGRVHYGDRAPAGVTAEALDLPAAPPQSAPDAVTGLDEIERFQRRKKITETLSTERKAKESLRKKNAEEKAKKLDNCGKLKIRIDESGAINRFYKRNEKGERVYMTDKERNSHINSLKQKYNEKCG